MSLKATEPRANLQSESLRYEASALMRGQILYFVTILLAMVCSIIIIVITGNEFATAVPIVVSQAARPLLTHVRLQYRRTNIEATDTELVAKNSRSSLADSPFACCVRRFCGCR